MLFIITNEIIYELLIKLVLYSRVQTVVVHKIYFGP